MFEAGFEHFNVLFETRCTFLFSTRFLETLHFVSDKCLCNEQGCRALARRVFKPRAATLVMRGQNMIPLQYETKNDKINKQKSINSDDFAGDAS